MQYTMYDEPFDLDEKTYMKLYDEMVDYFTTQILPLYTDSITEDPLTGFNLALTDMLYNCESPVQDENGEYLCYDDALRLGQGIFKSNTLDGKRMKDPFEGLDLPTMAFIRPSTV